MIPRHVFDAEGYWIAFLVGKEVFLRGGEWLGRLSGEIEVRDQDDRLRAVLDGHGRLSIIDLEPVRVVA